MRSRASPGSVVVGVTAQEANQRRMCGANDRLRW